MAEIGVKLSGDNSEFKNMMDDSVAKGDQFAGKLTTKLGDKLFGLRDVSTAVATALGLNLANIAENVARVLTGMSKEQEKAYRDIEALTTRIADMNIANARAMSTAETNYQLDLQKRGELEASLARQSADIAAANERQRLYLEEKQDFWGMKMLQNWRDRYSEAEKLLKLKQTEAEHAEVSARVDAAARKKEIDDAKELEKIYDASEKLNASVAEIRAKDRDERIKDEEKSSKISEYQGVLLGDLIKKEKERLDVINKQTSSFQSQLVKIAQMAGMGKEGFQADAEGGVATISLDELKASAAKAELAYKNAVSRGVQSPQDEEDLRKAQTLMTTLNEAVRNAGTGAGFMSNGFNAGSSRVAISSLNLGGLGLGESSAAQATLNVQKATEESARQLRILTSQFGTLLNGQGLSGTPAPMLDTSGLTGG